MHTFSNVFDSFVMCKYRRIEVLNGICFDGFAEQKSFHEDVVKVICRNLEEEEGLPEEQRPTALARSYYLTVRIFLIICLLVIVRKCLQF